MTPDPIQFIERTLVDPETGLHFRLTDAQKGFLRRAFKLKKDGRLAHSELIYSTPKKGGKTGLAACVMIYVVRVLAGRFGEGICAANDAEQSAGRVFAACVRILRASPMLAGEVDVTADKITFKSTGGTIIAIATDAAGSAGSNANIVSHDELWGAVSEKSRRFFDEHVPVPTRKISCRLTTTYSGFEGESVLLEDLYARGRKGEEVEPDLFVQPGMVMFWTHRFTAPWQTEEWREEMRASLRPNAFLRLIENRWVSNESTFVDIAWWDACVYPNLTPVVADRNLPVWVGLDASVKHDSTAIVGVTWDGTAKKVRLVAHRIFQPRPDRPLDFEATIEATVRDFRNRFSVRAIFYDPYQMAATAQRLVAAGAPMREYAQTPANLEAMGSNFYELVKGRGIVAYPDAEIRLAMSRAIAKETVRGFKITKEKSSHKIDVVVALAMAAIAAMEQGSHQPTLVSPIVYGGNEKSGFITLRDNRPSFATPWSAGGTVNPALGLPHGRRGDELISD